MAKDDEYLESVLKEVHKAELDRADKLDGSVNLPTAVLTVLLGVGAFYIEHLPPLGWSFAVLAFYASMTIFLGGLVAAVFCLFRSYFNYRYRILANPKELAEFSRALRAHYEGSGADEVNERVKCDVVINLIDQYVEASSQNRDKNLRRTNWLFRTTKCIIVSLIGLAVSKLLYQAIDQRGPQAVSIAGFPKDITIRLEPSGTQNVQLVNQPPSSRVEIIQGTSVQKVEMTGEPPVQRIEFNLPKKKVN